MERGGLVVDEVWGPGNSPVCITNNVSLSNVSVLPGTVIRAGSNVTITVLTTLRAIGTGSAPVVFEAALGNSNGWGGIRFENTVSGSEFDWCVIRGANDSALHLVRSTPTIRNTRFEGNSGGYGGAIYVDNTQGTVTITDCQFISNHSNNDGGALWARTGAGLIHVERCTFDSNAANPARTCRRGGGTLGRI